MNREKNLCLECPEEIRGICCYFHTKINGKKIRLNNQPCKYLDTKTGECVIYEDRYEKNKGCLDMEEAIKLGVLPKECLYVRDSDDYQERSDVVVNIDEVILTKKEKEKYERINNSDFKNSYLNYSVERSFSCKKCGSIDIKEKLRLTENKNKEILLYFVYACENCGNKWKNKEEKLHS